MHFIYNITQYYNLMIKRVLVHFMIAFHVVCFPSLFSNDCLAFHQYKMVLWNPFLFDVCIRFLSDCIILFACYLTWSGKSIKEKTALVGDDDAMADLMWCLMISDWSHIHHWLGYRHRHIGVVGRILNVNFQMTRKDTNLCALHDHDKTLSVLVGKYMMKIFNENDEGVLIRI